MNDIYLSILLIIVGLFIGIGLILIINRFRVNNAEAKIKIYLDKAQKEADKVKRDMLFNAKEEAHKLKMDLKVRRANIPNSFSRDLGHG